MTKPIELQLLNTQAFARFSTSTTRIAEGGVPGANAAFEFAEGAWQGFPGVYVRWKGGVGWLPVTALGRVDFDELPPEGVAALDGEPEPEPEPAPAPKRKRAPRKAKG